MKGLVVGRSRWIAPGATSLSVLVVAWLVVAVTVAWMLVWARHTASGAEVLSEASRSLGEPVALGTSLTVAWDFAMAHGETGSSAVHAPLEHPVPAPLCVASDSSALNAGIRDLERGLAGGPRAGLERRLRDLAELDVGPEERPRLVRAFALARAYLLGGDPVAASQLLDPGPEVVIGGRTAPVVGAVRAHEMARAGSVEPAWAAVVVHVRYLAGLAALQRGRPADAIPHLRFAVNGLGFLVAPAEIGMTRAPRARRLEVDPGDYACQGTPGARRLESTHLYAALVDAYLNAAEFHDPTRLRAELERTAAEADPGDALAPILAGALDGSLDVAPHLLWAASNLQRVDHNNRLRPDAGLSLVRTHLVLRLTEAGGPLTAQDVLACDALAGVGAAHVTDTPPGSETAVDSALGGVALTALARYQHRCASPLETDADQRSRLLSLGGHRVAGGLPGRLEEVRVELERALAMGAPTSEFERLLEPVDADLDMLGAGRTPPDLLRELDAGAAAEAAADWKRGLFEDVSQRMLPLLSGPGGGGRAAGESRRILDALGGAMRYAGLDPSHHYGIGQVWWAARSGGSELVIPNVARYGARSYPVGTGLVLMGLVLLGAFAALLVHVSWWRYELMSSRRFYVTETLDRWNREMGGAGTKAEGDWA